MPRVIVKTGNREQLYTGSIFYRPDRVLTIHPFDDDESFKLEFQLSIATTSEGSTSRVFGSPIGATLKHTRVWGDGGPSGNPGVAFASDETYTYFLSYIVELVGKPSNYAINFSYSILRESTESVLEAVNNA